MHTTITARTNEDSYHVCCSGLLEVSSSQMFLESIDMCAEQAPLFITLDCRNVVDPRDILQPLLQEAITRCLDKGSGVILTTPPRATRLRRQATAPRRLAAVG